MPGAGLRVHRRTRSDGEHRQAGYAELWLVNFFALLGSQRELVGIPVFKLCAGNRGKPLFGERPVRGVGLWCAVKLSLQLQ